MKHFTNMEAGHVYFIVGAMRGPDVYNSRTFRVLKHSITARIRSMVFEEFECFGIWIKRPLTESDLMNITSALEDARREHPIESEHFIEHLFDAVRVTAEHPVWGGLGHKLAETLAKSIGRCYWMTGPNYSGGKS